MIHIIDGLKGAAHAAENRSMAIIVDALRSSSTLCAILSSGAKQVLVCGDPQTALSLAAEGKEALVVGEYKSVVPEGFDFGNSPLEIREADIKGRDVIFTSTNGARMLVASKGSRQVVVGGIGNADFVAARAQEFLAGGGEVVIIPAGNDNQPCNEDVASAVVLAEVIGPDIAPGQEALMDRWRSEIAGSSLTEIFLSSDHGRELVHMGCEEDVRAAAEPNLFPVVPYVIEYINAGHEVVARLGILS